MILIADSGASKTDWSCIRKQTFERMSFISQGYNPNYISSADMVEDIQLLPKGQLFPPRLQNSREANFIS